jgi:hypothetical protein
MLPEDMQKYVRPPKKEKKDKDEKDKKKPTEKKEVDIDEKAVELIDDKDLDYKSLDNVELVLNKYKNQQISRRNFDPLLQITVLNIILRVQAANKNVLVEVYMLLVNTYFASAKSHPNGIFPRETWLTVNSIIKELLKNLNSVQGESKGAKAVV